MSQDPNTVYDLYLVYLTNNVINTPYVHTAHSTIRHCSFLLLFSI